MTYRCFDRSLAFYEKEPQAGIINEVISDEQVIDDDEVLRAAEEEIERQTYEDDERRCW